jgi:hypothetical protein
VGSSVIEIEICVEQVKHMPSGAYSPIEIKLSMPLFALWSCKMDKGEVGKLCFALSPMRNIGGARRQE